MPTEPLQKVLARAGVASRRKAERLIIAGRVRVDGRVQSLGSALDPERARIELDGRRLALEAPAYLVLNKPRGVVCTLYDPLGRRTVGDLVKGARARVVPVGRLDYQTSGVLLLSNDGAFTQGLVHPRAGVVRVYLVKVPGELDDERLSRWCDAIVIDHRRTRPAEVRRMRSVNGKTWLEVTLREGRNRHVRRLAEHAGFPVMRLVRLSFAGITAQGLRPGQWRALSPAELLALQRAFGVPKRIRAR
ncbi:MAG TPA: pseudouridine synthase [Polyangiaceae bacterium]|jgi:23S rRNA pseudouridine2605 synthase